MEDTRVWFYAVMIFIAFVSWLRKRIKDVAAARSERGDSQHYQSQEEDRRREESSQSSAQPSSAAPRKPNSLKELFEQVAAEQAQAQQQQTQARQVPQQVAPPPLPVAAREDTFHQSEDTFHQSEDGFHQSHQAVTKHEGTVPSAKPLKKRAQRSANRTRASISAAFSDRGKIRNALILKEILDTPKSMQ